MKGDFVFKLLEVREGWRYRAARMAVLTPIYGLEWKEDICRAMQNLRAKWHARLGEYKQSGWEPMQGERKQLFLRNCPPFGVITEQYARPCRTGGMLCPFCYARAYPIKMYNFLEECLYGGKRYKGDDNKLIKAPPGVRLVEFTYKSEVYPDKPEKWCADYIKSLLLHLQDKMRDSRQREVKMFKDARAAVFWRVEVFHDKLTLLRSGLILTKGNVPRRMAIPDTDTTQFTLRTHPDPKEERLTKQVIGRAVARVCAYPSSLFSAGSDEVLSMMEGLRGFRTLATYGGQDKMKFLKG